MNPSRGADSQGGRIRDEMEPEAGGGVPAGEVDSQRAPFGGQSSGLRPRGYSVHPLDDALSLSLISLVSLSPSLILP